MNSASLDILHTLAGIIVLAEALNKLERTNPFASGLSCRERVVVWLKSLGWFALAVGSAGAAGCTLLYTCAPSFGEASTMVGFALLVVRSRVGEVLPERQGRSG